MKQHISMTILVVILLTNLSAIRKLNEREEPINQCFPPIVIHTQVASLNEHYDIDYSCTQRDDIDLLDSKLKESVVSIEKMSLGKWSAYETRRGLCRQVQLMQKGVTPRLDSKHLIGHAVDFICYNNGFPSWDCDWEELGKMCRERGLIWGGDFVNRDFGHCELPPLQQLP